MKTWIAGGSLALLLASAAQAKPATELACIEQMFTDEQAISMARMGSADEGEASAAADEVNFVRLGMMSRMCAIRGRWSENEYMNSIGYMMAWSTGRGLRLLGEEQGYAAIERAWAASARELVGKPRLNEGEIDGLLTTARGDGLTLPDGEAPLRYARRYADVLQQIAAMRADFEANRPPRNR